MDEQHTLKSNQFCILSDLLSWFFIYFIVDFICLNHYYVMYSFMFMHCLVFIYVCFIIIILFSFTLFLILLMYYILIYLYIYIHICPIIFYIIFMCIWSFVWLQQECLLCFWILFAATQLALQLHQKCTQVACSNREARKRPAESNSTPAMDPGHVV